MPSLSPKDRISLCLFSFSDGRPSRRPLPLPPQPHSSTIQQRPSTPLHSAPPAPPTSPKCLHQLVRSQHLHPPKKYLIHAQAH
jgi:hypothetical protein